MHLWTNKQRKALLRKLRNDRLCKHIQKASRFEFDDPKDKNFWKTSIDELELESRKSAWASRVKKIDLSTVLPAELQGRVGKIIPLAPLEAETDDDEPLTEELKLESKSVEDFQLDASLMKSLADSQFAHNQDDFELAIDEAPKPRKPSVFPANWMADYFKKPHKERIVWQTKLYQSRQRFEDKSLFEQVEELTDLSAESFVQWLNELGQEKSDVTEDMIKKLFSIGIEEGVSRAMKFGSKYVGAVGDNVASYYDLEKKGIRRSVQRATEMERKFRGFKRHQEPDVIPEFFKQIRTFEGIFKGITNLTSIQLLVEHLRANPHIEKPQYLVDLGMFEDASERASRHTLGAVSIQKSLYRYD